MFTLLQFLYLLGRKHQSIPLSLRGQYKKIPISMTDTNNIKVYVRFKPLDECSSDFRRGRDVSPAHYEIINDSRTINIAPQKIPRKPAPLEGKVNQSTAANETGSRLCNFTYDFVFPGRTTQNEIFEHTISPIVESTMRGYNASILCYGQTGSGKTYTMLGDSDDEQQRGIIPRLFAKIFDKIERAPDTSQYTVALSYFEIYNDVIHDLLNPNTDPSQIHIRESHTDETQENSRGSGPVDDSPAQPNVYVEGLDKFYVADIEDVNQVLKIGNSNREVAETKMNSSSSRSHSILRVEICVRDNDDTSYGKGEEVVYNSTLFLVDLAGSERLNKSGTNSSHNSLKETIGINSSLSALGNVINILGSETNVNGRRPHIPYRDSKLTRVLANSLGGNSKTAMIITCSSNIDDFNETLSSLRFAQRAKNVQNTVSRNRSVVENYRFEASPTQDAGDTLRSWKSKYVTALKKLVDLEARLESPNFRSLHVDTADSDIVCDQDEMERLREENMKLRDELNIYKTSFKEMNNTNLANTLEYKTTFKSLQSLKADVDIYKKLLVTKTDQIIQLEDELEELKSGGWQMTDYGSKELDSLHTMKSMSDTIQVQNDELLQQVEKAEQLLLCKEQELRNATLKWANRDSVVSEEQSEVEKKLEQMSRRLKSAINGDILLKGSVNNGNIKIFSDSDKHEPELVGSINDNNNSFTKKGVNLRIVKPR